MKNWIDVQPNNAVRAWTRRAKFGLRGRPDVGLLQLERKVQVLEEIVGVHAAASSKISAFAKALAPYQFENLELTRVGSNHDGGYILPTAQIVRGMQVLSIGIGDNNEADVALAEMGGRVHAWDHTIEFLPRKHERIAFHRVGLSGHPGTPECRTLSTIISESFGPDASNLTLLLDVEGAEWDAINQASETDLDRFCVIAIEWHFLGDILAGSDQKVAVLQKLREKFVPVAIHANNYGAAWNMQGRVVPDTLEVTYVNSRTLSQEGFRGNCDRQLLSPCCPDMNEIDISWIYS